MLLETGIVLPLLQRLHLQLGNGGLHAVNMFAEHCVLLLKLRRLLSQLTQFVFPGLKPGIKLETS